MSDYYLNIKSTDTEEKILLEDDENNKTVWDSTGLEFFTSEFPDTPIWYNKRVAYGVAEHGEYVDLSAEGNWERPPNIHLSISNFPVFKESYEWNGQNIEVNANNITTDGFDVIARLNALTGQRSRDYDTPYPQSVANLGEEDVVQCPETNTNCTRVTLSGNAYAWQSYSDAVKNEATVELYKYNFNDDSWDYQEDLYYKYSNSGGFDEDFNVDSGQLTPGKYTLVLRSKTTILWGDSSTEGTTKVTGYSSEEYYDSETEIATGQVNWIAVENAE